MKIIFVVKYYDAYRATFYSRIKGIDALDYDELNERFINDYFSFYSSLIKILRAKGYEAELIIANCEIIRAKWQIKLKKENALNNYDFVLSATEFYKPDFIFLSSNFEYFGDFAVQLKGLCKALFCWISCPYDNKLDLTVFRTIFTLFPPYYNTFMKSGIQSKLVTAGFDPAVLERVQTKIKKRSIPFSFIGGVGKGHSRREHFIKKIIAKTPLQIWGYGFSSENPIKRVLKNAKNMFIYSKKYQGQAWGMDMFEILYQSKITLNVHGDLAGAISVNMRLFEATGMGTLLLTDHSDNIAELFIPDVEIVTYKTPEEAIEKYKYYSTHDEERKKIAAAGQKKTLELYSYNSIATTFIDEFMKALKK